MKAYKPLFIPYFPSNKTFPALNSKKIGRKTKHKTKWTNRKGTKITFNLYTFFKAKHFLIQHLPWLHLFIQHWSVCQTAGRSTSPGRLMKERKEERNKNLCNFLRNERRSPPSISSRIKKLGSLSRQMALRPRMCSCLKLNISLASLRNSSFSESVAPLRSVFTARLTSTTSTES